MIHTTVYRLKHKGKKMITIIQVLVAMDHVNYSNRSWADREAHTQRCWWNNESINRTLWEADKLGIVSRMSTTQVQWTQKGIDMINGAAA